MEAFSEYVVLLGAFLDRRGAIVERIEAQLLNVQGKPASARRDRPFFEHALATCFYGAPGLAPDVWRLKGRLAARHAADGFKTVAIDRHVTELDPVELIGRAYLIWRQSRWPGRSGRLTFACAIYVVFMLRELERLSLRVWDGGEAVAGVRLSEVQHLLERLNAAPSSPVFVRDARWLVQTAQGPLTLDLAPYFTIMRAVGRSFDPATRLGLHDAGARLAGGHLRSQLRYRVWSSGRPADDPEVLAFTRNSNAMDLALLICDLVPLLEAYKAATIAAETDNDARLALADAILQGFSADPDLTVTRFDLLRPYTTLETLFVERGDGTALRISELGDEYFATFDRYTALVADLASALADDAALIDPPARSYSPFGIVYGFVADVLTNMAMDVLVGQASHGVSLEDVFTSRGRLDEKRARAEGWVRLPQRPGEREHFEHSSQWAAETCARVTRALAARACHGSRPNASNRPDARLVSKPPASTAGAAARKYCFTSDPGVAASGATFASRTQMLSDRSEGRFLASAEIQGEWVGVSKLLLTTFLAQGEDAVTGPLPAEVEEEMSKTCPAIRLDHEWSQ